MLLNRSILDANQYDYDYNIALPALVVFTLGAALLSRFMPKGIAIIIMAIKVSIAVLYFCFFKDGSWGLSDDVAYFERALILASTDRDPIRLWWHHESIYLKTQHSRAIPIFVFYISMYIFGSHYFSPVLLNILITAVSAFFIHRILISLSDGRFDDRYALYGTIYFCLHWSTVVWSSFLILKEPIVICLMTGIIYFILIARQSTMKAIMGTIFTSLLMIRARFYFPTFFVGGIVFSLVNQFSFKMLVVVAYISSLGIGLFLAPEVRLFLNLANFSQAPYGLVHFLLQPAPWKITEPASYLLIPSIFHWLATIPTFLGAILLLKSDWKGRFIVGTFLTAVIFYALVPWIASTRHRAPLDALMLLMQFHFFYFVFSKYVAVIRQR